MSETMKPSIQAALAQVQSVMQVPKNSYNAFGKYPIGRQKLFYARRSCLAKSMASF